MPIGPGSPTPSGFPFANIAYGIPIGSASTYVAAQPLPAFINTVTTAITVAGQSVVLPACYPGAQVIVINNQSVASAITVWAYQPTAGVADGIIASGASATAATVSVSQFHATLFLGILGEGGNTVGGVGPSVGGIWKACVLA